MYRLLALMIGLVVYASLFPWHFVIPGGNPNPLVVLWHSWPDKWDLFTAQDSTLNVAVYFPLGVVAFLALGRARRAALAVASALCIGLVLSGSLEILQVYVPGRTSSMFDVLTNFAGIAAGTLVAVRFRTELEALLRHSHGKLGAAVLIASWAACHLYPFSPLLSLGRLRYEFFVLLHPCAAQFCCCSPVYFLADTWSGVAEWFVAMGAVQTLTGSMRARWLIAALCLRIALRPIVITRPLGPDEVLGALVALLLWKALHESGRLRVSLWTLSTAVFIRGLEPFHFSSAPGGFSWIPFQTAIESVRQGAALGLFRSVFDYGGLVWLLSIAGRSYAKAGLLVATFAAVLGGVQCFIPGRQPTITDPVLALLIAIGFALASRTAVHQDVTRGARCDRSCQQGRESIGGPRSDGIVL